MLRDGGTEFLHNPIKLSLLDLGERGSQQISCSLLDFGRRWDDGWLEQALWKPKCKGHEWYLFI